MKNIKKHKHKDFCPYKKNDSGFTLLELIIAMAVGLVVLSAMYGVFTTHNKTFGDQERIAEMQQSARSAMDMMAREIRMAGYNPADATFDGVTYSASQLQIRADLNGDGDTADSNENIIYTYDSTDLQIERNTGAGAQPFAENIQTFTFDYLDEDGTATITTADIRRVSVTITARTSEPDPDYTPNSGYRTYSLTSVITPRNLGL